MNPGDRFVKDGVTLIARASDGTCTRCIGSSANRHSELGCMALPPCNAHDNPGWADIHFEAEEETK